MNSNTTGVRFPGGSVITANNDQLGSVTGRIGYTWGPGLLYAKGGYAWRDNPNIGVTAAGVPVAFTTTGNEKSGWTVGAGLEYMFAPNWSAKAEYQYYNFGSATFVAPPPAVAFGSFTTSDQVLSVGVNYRINWSGPLMSRY